MLKKLLKYDLKALFPWYGIAFGLCLLMGVLTNIAISTTITSAVLPEIGAGGMSTADALAMVFSSTFLMLSIVGLFVITVATSLLCTYLPAWLFYKNYIKDEGYLMFTLPVTPGQLYASKMLSALLGSYASGAVIIASFVIAFSGFPGSVAVTEIFNEIGPAFGSLTGGETALLVATGVVYLLFCLLAPVAAYSTIYASFMFGQLAPKNHFIWSIVAYFSIEFVLQTVVQVVSMILSFSSFGIQATLQSVFAPQLIMISGMFVLYLAITIALIVSSNVIMKKHLNLV